VFFLRMVLRNAFRHRLRTALTIAGLAVAVLAYGLLQTVVGAWYAGADAASNARLVTRNSISLVFPLPLSYHARIRSVEGVTEVAYSNWFGGIYREPKNFFPQFAVSANYLNLYPEFVLDDEQLLMWQRDRRGALVGRQLAEQFDFKVGDMLPLRGTIYPGTWEFVIRGIFDGSDETRITRQMLFHWDYLNEFVRKARPRGGNMVGVYISGIVNPADAAVLSREIDAMFRNSLAETMTETEQAFQLGFVAMSDQIIAAIRIVSYVVILIILAVMANTMAMSARERTAEYATLKALGFRPRFLVLLIFGESIAICAFGGGLGLALTWPAAEGFGQAAGGIFPVFQVSTQTAAWQAGCALAVGVLAAIVPAATAARVRIVDGLRAIA
jgi:putative ABC transport system permease protein